MDHTSKQVYSLIDRLTSEGSDTLILPITSKSGQFVFFNLGVTSEEVIFWHFIGLISDSRLKGTRDRTKRSGILAFVIDFYLGIPVTDSRHPQFSLSSFSGLHKL